MMARQFLSLPVLISWIPLGRFIGFVEPDRLSVVLFLRLGSPSSTSAKTPAKLNASTDFAFNFNAVAKCNLARAKACRLRHRFAAAK